MEDIHLGRPAVYFDPHDLAARTAHPSRLGAGRLATSSNEGVVATLIGAIDHDPANAISPISAKAIFADE